MSSILNTWPWYITGPLIGLFVPFLLVVSNKLLGISSSFQHICSIVLNTKKFSVSGYNAASNRWKFLFVIGILLGGLFCKVLLTNPGTTFLPENYYTAKGLTLLFAGGFLVGFGTRYANGCTSGHSISGISTFQLSGLIATVSFFIGGLIYTHFLFSLFN